MCIQKPSHHFFRPYIHYACLRLCSSIVHFIQINCVYFVCYDWPVRALTASTTLTIPGAWKNCCTSSKTAKKQQNSNNKHSCWHRNIQAFDNISVGKKKNWKTKKCLQPCDSSGFDVLYYVLFCLFLSTCVLQSVCVHTMDFVSARKQINWLIN